jgi:hypothetical protein
MGLAWLGCVPPPLSLFPLEYLDMSMIVTVELPNNIAVELTGANCKVWLGYGLPDYEGPIDGLAEALPDVLRELQAGGFIKSV